MQLSKIKPGKWYQTKRGDLRCTQIVGRRVVFGAVHLNPADVHSEIHDSEAPTKKESAASKSSADLLESAELASILFGEILAKGCLPQALASRAEFTKRALNDAIAEKKGLK